MIDHLDYPMLTVRDIDLTCEFSADVLDMQVTRFARNRKALKYASRKINLYQAGHEFESMAAWPTTGSADLRYTSNQPLEKFSRHLNDQQIDVEAGPIQRTRATQAILSVYIRDPDGNLLKYLILARYSHRDAINPESCHEY